MRDVADYLPCTGLVHRVCFRPKIAVGPMALVEIPVWTVVS